MSHKHKIPLVGAMLACVVALPAFGASQSSEEQQQDVFLAYARVRDRLYDCHISRVQDTLSSEDKRSCRRLNRRYTLFAYPGESHSYHVHCRTSRCLETPSGHPPADGPYPEGATIYRWPGVSSAHHSRRHRHH
jgi:hypothetical protein